MEEFDAVTTEPIVEVEGLTVDFEVGNSFFNPDRIRGVNNANFKLYPGRALALVGESGSGKSTCARALVKLNDYSTGKVIVDNDDIKQITKSAERREYSRKIQMIFQDPFGSLNSVHNIAHHLSRPIRIHNRNLTKKEVKEKVLSLLTRVGLQPVEDTAQKYPHQLSGGQRQRVAIARALAMNAKIVLADEPISMLDVSIRLGILNLMEDMKNNDGIAFLYITHDIATARYFAEDIAVMYVGHMVEWGDSEVVTSDPVHPYTKLLLSSIPDPERKNHKVERVEGKFNVPQWTPQTTGCPFAERCPLVMDKCKTVFPDAKKLGDKQYACCHAL